MKFKAAVLVDVGGPFEIREYPLPEVEPGGILAKIDLTSICGSDVHIFKGEIPARLPSKENPMLIGHEAIATVYRLGRDVKTDFVGGSLREGDRITFCYFSPCKKCWTCMNGVASCPNRLKSRGFSEKSPHLGGTYAEYYYITPGQWVYKVPEELSAKAVAPLNCALSTAVQAVSKVGVGFGDAVLVQGAGGLGLSAMAVAKDMGAPLVIATEKNKDRLRMAKEFGADELIDLNNYPSEEERIDKVKKLTGGRGVDLVLEFIGISDGISEGIKMLTPGGTYLLSGMISGAAKINVNATEFVFQGKKLWGSGNYESWVIPKALDFLNRTKENIPSRNSSRTHLSWRK